MVLESVAKICLLQDWVDTYQQDRAGATAELLTLLTQVIHKVEPLSCLRRHMPQHLNIDNTNHQVHYMLRYTR